jgi:hypothetical protein
LRVSVKVKAIPVQTWTSPEGTKRLRLPYFKTISIYEKGQVVSHTHRSFLSPGNIPGTQSSLRLSRPQGHTVGGRIMSMRNPSGIEPVTFCVVAQCHNQLRHREAPCVRYNFKILANSPCLSVVTLQTILILHGHL